MTISIAHHSFNSLTEVKAFAKLQNIAIEGDKWVEATWVEAVEDYCAMQAEVIAAVEDAEEVAVVVCAWLEAVAPPAAVYLDASVGGDREIHC